MLPSPAFGACSGRGFWLNSGPLLGGVALAGAQPLGTQRRFHHHTTQFLRKDGIRAAEVHSDANRATNGETNKPRCHSTKAEQGLGAAGPRPGIGDFACPGRPGRRKSGAWFTSARADSHLAAGESRANTGRKEIGFAPASCPASMEIWCRGARVGRAADGPAP